MVRMGWSIDWTRELSTAEPEYYRWTQWIFLRLLEAGLAYRREAAVKWCPVDQTVLANEQVIDGRCERCGSEVESRSLEQWFFKITAYADRLLDDLAEVSWPERVVTMQRNWIGRSHGARVVFRLEGGDESSCRCSPPAPTRCSARPSLRSHPSTRWCWSWRVAREHETEVADYVRHSAGLSAVERASEKVKTGVFTGRYVINPVNDERIPVWVADYVLMEYGTGALMAVPAHDDRDYEFAHRVRARDPSRDPPPRRRA